MKFIDIHDGFVDVAVDQLPEAHAADLAVEADQGVSAVEAATAQRQHEAAEARWLDAFLAGPTRTRWAALPPQVGDAAPDVTLTDTAGRPVRLSALWSEGPVLLVFLRHFGCSCLSERMSVLQRDADRLREAGATVIAVTQAEPERTAAVAERRGYSLRLLADPQRRAYDAFGLLQGTPPQVLHDHPWVPNDHETVERHFAPRRGTERAGVDDPWQLPGDALIGTDGRIAYVHRYQFCEDHPPLTVTLGAIATLVRASAGATEVAPAPA